MEGVSRPTSVQSINNLEDTSTSGSLQWPGSPKTAEIVAFSREIASVSPPRAAPYLPGKPPVTFKVDRKPRSIREPNLPPLPGSLFPDREYMSRHHTLIPRSRGPSAFIKRHHVSHGMLDAAGHTIHSSPVTMEDLDGRTAERMGPPPAVRTAILKALASNAELQPEPYRDAADEARQSQWRTTSVGDLETIDSMLDQLVVADSRMREALLKGPLISFETVIPEASSTLSSMAQDGEEPDTTFITAVPGQGLEGEGEEEDQRGDLQSSGEPSSAETSSTVLPLPVLPQPSRPDLTGNPPQTALQTTAFEDIARLRESIPVPILPKLARMYITSRQAQERHVIPLPPPTADYLVSSRPPPSIAAPSYDELCSQIMNVQRQYTCGTSKDRGVSPGRPKNNMEMYISGLDGPSLDDVCALEELPAELRSRPSYVSMKKGGAKGSVKSGRNQGRPAGGMS